MEKVWHPFVTRGEWRMENGFVVKPLHKKLSPFSILHPWRRRSFLHSPFSSPREWALHHSRRACHVPILWEWGGRGVTTPNKYVRDPRIHATWTSCFLTTGFGSSTIAILVHIDFAYGIQMRHSFGVGGVPFQLPTTMVSDMIMRYTCVIWFSFFVLRLLLIVFMSSSLCCINEFTMKKLKYCIRYRPYLDFVTIIGSAHGLMP